MKWTRKVIAVFLIIIMVFALTGCWNYMEVNDTFVVVGAAVGKNKSNGNYILSVETLQPSKEKSATLMSYIISAEGKTVFDAIRNIVMVIGRKLYWGHMRVWLISKDIAEEGMVPVLDLISREAELRSDIWVAVAKDDDVENVFAHEHKMHEAISYRIQEMLDDQATTSKYPDVQLFDLLNDLASTGKHPILPLVKCDVNPVEDNEEITKLEGSAVFCNDKMKGTLDEIETRSTLIINGNIKGGAIFALDEEHLPRVSYEAGSISTELIPEVKGKQIYMKIEVELDGHTGELMTTEDYITKDKRKILETAYAKTITKELQDTIKKVQKQYKSDIFGFGDIIRRKEPNEWKKIEKQWKEIFPTVEVEVTVDLHINGSALSMKPLEIGE